MDNIAKELPFAKDMPLPKKVDKARKLIKRIDCDNFYAMNSEILSFLGSIIMWFTLC